MGQLLVSVNGDSVWRAHSVTPGSTVTVSAVAPQGFSTCEWEYVSNSDPDVAAPVFTKTSLGTATFPFMANPGDQKGRAMMLRCVIDRGRLTESRFTFIVGFPGALTVIPFCAGEHLERDPIYGWTKLLQAIVANSSTLDTTKLPLDGSGVMTGDLNFGGRNGINLADPENDDDADTMGARNAAITLAISNLVNTSDPRLHQTRYKRTSEAAMLAISDAQVGDDCIVSNDEGDQPFLAVQKGKYPYGLLCREGNYSIDWLIQVDTVYGETDLVSGYRFEYIAGIPEGAHIKAGHLEGSGDVGVVMPRIVENGIELRSTSQFDNGSVWYEITL